MIYLRKSRVYLLCCLLLAAAACSSTRTDNAGGNNAAPPSTAANPTAGGANPRAALSAAVKAQLEAKSFRAQMQSSTSSGTTSAMVVEYVAPDRFHMTQDAQLPGRGSVKQEFIIVGKDTWLKMGAGAWQKFPVDVGQIVAQFRDPKVLEQLAQNADIKFVGADTLDGAPALVYEYTLTGELAKNIKSTSKTWIGATDNLPRKIETEGELQSTGQPLKTKTTIIYTGYNSDIKIEPPK